MPSIVFRGASFALRVGEIGFAAVIAGIVGTYIRHLPPDQQFNGRLLYIIILASISITLAVIWLLPFSHTFKYFPFDFIIGVTWFVAFGLLIMVNGTQVTGTSTNSSTTYLNINATIINDNSTCNQEPFKWHGITDSGTCNQFKAMEAFSFLSACFWLGSYLLGALLVWMERRERKRKAEVTPKAKETTKA